MRIRIAFAIAVVVAGLGAPVYVHAAPSDNPMPVHAVLAKSKIVKLAVRNDSGVSAELKVGDQVMSLDAGKTMALKLPVGTRILMNSATPNHSAGELLTEISIELNNTTLAFK